jgi:hypothetical protein
MKAWSFLIAALAAAPVPLRADEDRPRVRHVLLLSVDGMHAVDLAKWIEAHPASTLARLSRHGVTYTEARATTPSDSFPGLLALVTGGTPRSTGVYYDDSYDRTLYPPGSNCSGVAGTEVVYDESVDFDVTRLFSGGIDPKNMPLARDASGCHPVFPHSFIQVNTIFEVVKAAGGRTAWSDKHPAYDLVQGPSGKGVDDLYTPEINSEIAKGGTANGVDLAATLQLCKSSNALAKVTVYTDCIPSQEAYDDVKVQAVVNWIEGKRAEGQRWADGDDETRAPAVFGMNFQAVSVGQKLPVGGYADAEGTPSANLLDAIAHTDASIGRMVAALERRDLLESTLIIVTAKHGQSPIDRSKLAMERGAHPVADPIDFVNSADPRVDSPGFTFTNTNNSHDFATGGHLQTDDVGLLWLQDRSKLSAVVAQLTDPAHRAAIHADVLPDDTIFSDSITSGAALAAIFGDPSADALAAARAPDVFIQPNHGVIYSGSSEKIAEHGGGTTDDTNVALLVSLPSLPSRMVAEPVQTTQVAATILEALGLEPRG